jgi:DNA-binding transcriptional MerR regulator
VDHELRAWIKSLAARPRRRADGESRQFSPEDAAYLRRIVTDGTLKVALHEIAASEPDLAD